MVTAAGVIALLAGLGGELALVGVGALTTFVGVSILGPVLARPVASVFGIPLRMRGLSGELATRNALRNPKRTARTASSLMIGVALVGFITVFAASAKTSMAGSLESEFTGTHIVEAGAFDNSSGLSPDLADELRGTSRRRRRHPGSADPGDRRRVGDGCVQRLRRHDRRRDVRAR